MSEPTDSSAFDPPAAESAAPPKPHKHHGRLPGGQLPPVGDLFSNTMQEFMDHLGPYALAGLGQMLVMVPIIVVFVFVMYFGMFAMMFGIMAAMFGAIAVLGEDVGLLLGIVIELLGFAALFVAILAMAAVIAGVMAPINASLTRAIAAHQRGEKTLEFNAAFTTLTQDIVAVVLVALTVSTLAMIGALMCYFPALLAGFLFGLAIPAVALHRLGVGASLKAMSAHVLANPGWHAAYFGVYLLVALVGAYVPVIGPMFGLAFQVRAYRELFGDGEEPVLELAA